MKQTIYKYEVKTSEIFTIQMPRNSKILSVQMQRGTPYIWAVVNPDAEDTETRTFELYGTGHDMPEGKRNFIGTFQPSAYLVFHLFESL